MAQPTSVEGRTIGRYRVLKHVATGGMAEIYLARYDDRGVEREAVVKVILRERARDRKFVQMFLDEARVSSTFMHPNIGQLFEVGRDGDTYFYAMEYVAGDNVRALIERSLRQRVYMPVPVTVTIGVRVAAALHYAHERSSSSGQQLNAVHRDVTPSNIMLGFDGAVKLLDFGIARADSRAAMSQTGTVKGKFAYMSPEQCKGLQVDRRTDVFALGIVLYEVSTQRRAFRAESDFDTMERIIRGDLIPPHRIHPTYPRALEAILLRALATDPDERYQTAADLGQALAGFALDEGVPTDEQSIVAIMRQLFAAEAPPLAAAPAEEEAPRSPPPAMSLASMLAATVEPVTAGSGKAAATMVPVPPPVRGRRPSTTPSEGIPPPGPRTLRTPAPAPGGGGAFASPAGRPGFGPSPSGSMPAMIHAPVPAAEARALAALGTPPAMARVAPDDDAAEFARSSGSMPVITIEEGTGSGAMFEEVTPVPYDPVTPMPSTGFTPSGPWPAPAVPGEHHLGARPTGSFTVADEPEAHRLGLWVAIAAILAVCAVVAAVLVLSSVGIF